MNFSEIIIVLFRYLQYIDVYELLKFLNILLNLQYLKYREALIVISIIIFSIVTLLYLDSNRRMRRERKIKNATFIFPYAFNLLIISLVIIIFSLRLTLKTQYLLATLLLVSSLVLSGLQTIRANILLSIIMSVLVESILIMNLNIDITESTPDTITIMFHGSQGHSLKDSFYDVLNVYSALKAILSLVLGISKPENVYTFLMLTHVICILLTIIIYTLTKNFYKDLGLRSFIPTIVMFATVPPVRLRAEPPSISAILAFLVILLLLKTYNYKKNLNKSDLVIPTIMFTISILAHGTGIVVVAFLVIANILMKFTRKERKIPFYCFLVLYLIIASIRTLYVCIERSAFMVYISDIVRWFTGFGTVRREVRLEIPTVPRITAYSWALPVTIALVPLTIAITKMIFYKSKKLLSRENHTYILLTVTGLVFIVTGFIATFFSNSLGRELYYPGFISLLLAVPYTLNRIYINSKSIKTFILYMLIAFHVVTGMFSPHIASLLPEYRQLTLAWRGADYNHYLYARTVVFLVDETTPLIHVKTNDKIPIGHLYRLVYGMPPEILTIRHVLESEQCNIILMFDIENYITIR